MDVVEVGEVVMMEVRKEFGKYTMGLEDCIALRGRLFLICVFGFFFLLSFLLPVRVSKRFKLQRIRIFFIY